MKKQISQPLATLLLLTTFLACKAPSNTASTRGTTPNFDIIAYYNGDGSDLEKYKWEQMTQVIYSFCHLKGKKLAVDDAKDSLVILKLVAYKRENPKLKVLLSLGGWGGCKTCSDVFSTAAGSLEFAQSVKKLMKEYGADGIDLDWEYPGIEGFPEHPYKPEDKQNFTQLVEILRMTLGKNAEISFAAGGFGKFFDQSVEWTKVMPLVNRVNLMSYDLVSGFSTVTGHHTPLFSTESQEASTDHGVRELKSLGVPANKIVIGAAFYARTWVNVANINTGLYQKGKFKSFVPYKNFSSLLTPENDFVFYRDLAAQAPYAYSASRNEFATFDDVKSVEAKTRFAKAKGLGGIMFWQLGSDLPENGLLDAIYKVTREPNF